MISVVITCYNLAAYIGEAIESVLAQDYAGAVEIIVVDDCSTDASADIIRGFERVTYLRTPQNGGVMLAMMHGINAARGDLVALLDGDDVWEPEKLSRTAASFDDPRTGFSTHDLTFVDETGTRIGRSSEPEKILSPTPTEQLDHKLRDGILGLGSFIWLGSAMTIRKTAIDWGGFADWVKTLPDPRNVYQDWPLAYWIALRPQSLMTYVDAKLFGYRLHGANHSGDASTADRAARNYRRACLTVRAMADLPDRAGQLSNQHRKVVAARLRHYESKLLAYQGKNRLKALALHLRALPDLASRGLAVRETMAVGALLILGPSGFTRLRARLSR